MSEQTQARRTWLIVCAVALPLFLAVAGYLVGATAGGGAHQAEANAGVTVVTAAKVEHVTLEEQAELIGVYRGGAQVELAPPMLGEDAQVAVVTGAGLEVEETISPGSVLVEISGRPYFALDLPFAMYRDLTPGVSGPDVREVQEALGDLGFYQGSVDGVYGAMTSRAVEAWYKAAGYEPPAPPEEALAAVESAQEALRSGSTDPEPAPSASAPPQEASRSERDDAARDLRRAQQAAATPLPLGSVAAIPAGSRVVATSPVGTVLGEGLPVMTVQAVGSQVELRANVEQGDTLEVGAQVAITGKNPPAEVTGTVGSISEFTTETSEATGSGVPGYDVVISLPSETEWSDGTTVTVTANLDGADSGPAVPVTAIRQDSEGTFVEVLTEVDSLQGDGVITVTDPETERRGVEMVATDDRFAIVTGEVGEGDYVVVGTS